MPYSSRAAPLRGCGAAARVIPSEDLLREKKIPASKAGLRDCLACDIMLGRRNFDSSDCS
ncbi:hypothetical protein ColTof4_04295 [Colletotrichum tofieldiae]|nr:hypothetical protein ColTof3_14143 [Colletotrichum tofieldiae]GKT71872.1 hypothetical protein ColTof4_04295 [Colletotrichum tofieldiae]